MKIYTDLQDLKAINPVVSFGIFDGVHLGHKKIIKTFIDVATQLQGESVLVTFWPHPKQVINKNTHPFKLLTTLEEKKFLLEKENIDHLVIIPFTKEFAQQTSQEFLKNYLVDKIHIKHLAIGFNQNFGKKREGDFASIQSCSKKYNFTVEQVKAETYKGEIISSSKIRTLLLNGDINTSNNFLGHEFFIKGKVSDGKKIGREIGFPTANIHVKEEYKLIPKDGVYAVYIKIDGIEHKGMLNIGIKPTVNNQKIIKTIEAHIFDFNKNIYNKPITIFFKKRIRNEKKFKSLELLVEQLKKDKINALKLLSK